MNKTLGARIAELRKEKGLTQEELAKQLGISSQAVSKWEKDISCPDIIYANKKEVPLSHIPVALPTNILYTYFFIQQFGTSVKQSKIYYHQIYDFEPISYCCRISYEQQ